MLIINKISFAICLLCILAATTISIMAIWEFISDETVVARVLATCAVIFLAAVVTVVVNNLFLKKPNDKNGPLVGDL